MALVPASATGRGQRAPEIYLEDAIRSFQDILTDEQRSKLQEIKTIPDADAVMTFTAQLDISCRSRKGRSIASRLHSVLQCVREFSAIVDTFVQSHPEIAALVWGGIKVTMLIALNYTSYFNALSDIFLGLKPYCPRYEEYQALFPTSIRLQRALCNFHAAIIQCCRHVVQALHRPWQKQVYNALHQSCEQEFRADSENIRQRGEEVREEVALAKAQADHQHQQLEETERKAAAGHRWEVRSLLKRNSKKLEDIKDLQLQRAQQQSRDQRHQLLAWLSSHDHRKPFAEAVKRRHPLTAHWLCETSKFQKWKAGAGPSLLWCSGGIGSGKTIVTSSVIEDLYASKNNETSFVGYVFARFDDPESLTAETIIRSILRQSLDLSAVSAELDEALACLRQTALCEIRSWKSIFSLRFQRFTSIYIILDGLDECEATEVHSLLEILSDLSSCLPALGIFISSRTSLASDIEKRFPDMEHISMKQAEESGDIRVYVEGTLGNRIAHRELIVGDEGLIEEIQTRLTQHARGMFLWVSYLIDDLCVESSDEDIRIALTMLPKNLEQSFGRALLRIKRKNLFAKKIFPWVAVAKRPLALDELREAISIDVGQPFSQPEKLVNGLEHIVAWSQNLLHIDEEHKTVHFGHHSISQYILNGSFYHELAEYKFDIELMDHHAGEICVTYLNLNDFKTTLAHRPRKMLPNFAPAMIAQAPFSKKPRVAASINRLVGSYSKDIRLDSFAPLASFDSANKDGARKRILAAHPFLLYAERYWLPHAADFSSKGSKTWELWANMILHGHALAQTPWPEGEFGQIKTEIRYWTWKHEHKALFQVLLVFGGLLDGRTPSKLMADLAREGKTCLLQALFEQHGSAADLADIFLAAVDGKQLSALDLLLSFGADVNARVQVEGTHTFGQGNPVEVTPLHLAASNGDEEIIKRLISAGADVNALIRGVGINAMPIFSTALDMACKGGWYSIIFLLLSKGANPRLPYDSTNGSALTAASYFGSTVIVRKLLLAGANINARQHNGTYGTALIAATSEGRLAVIQELLNAGANVNTQAYFCPHTALIAAAMRGRADVVNYLLDVGAHVNAQAPGTAAFGTALIAAVHSGVMQVVDSLLAAGADVNAQVPGTVRDGTALITATSRQNKDMVLRLLAAGADTNAVVKLGEHKTALGVAAHLTNSGILDHLLGAGADAQLAYDKLSPRKNLQVADQEARRRLRQAFRF